MDSQSAPVVSAAKLAILNPNEFDLWKIRIEQYFLMIDYSLWEVIINGDSVISRVAVDGVAQPVTVLTTDLPSEWKTHTLIWRNKDNLEEHSLDDLFNISAATSVFAVCAKLPVSSHQNIDSLSNVVIFSFFASQSTNPQLDNEDLNQIDTGRNLGDNRVITMGFDMSKVECYNCHRKGHFARECRSIKDTRRIGGVEPHKRPAPVETSTSNALVSQCDGIGRYDFSYQAEEEPVNFAFMAIPSSSSFDYKVQSCSTACSKAYKQLHSQYDSQTVEFRKSRLDVLSYQAALEFVESRLVVYKQNESIFQENIIVLKNEVEVRDNFILTLKQKLKQAETERDDLKLKLSPSGGYHAVPPPITGNFMPPKPDLVFNTASLAVESNHSAFNVQVSPAKPAQAMSHTTESMAPIIEDWVSDSEDESKPNDPQSVFVQPVEVPILAVTPKPTIKTSSSGKRKNRKTCFVCRSVDHLIKDCNFHVKPQTKPTPRNFAHKGCNKQYASFTKKYPHKNIVPAAVLTKSKPVFVTADRQVSTAISKIMKSRPRPAHPLNRKSNPSIRGYKTHNQFSKTSNSSLKVTAAKVSVVSDVKGKKGKWGNPQYALKDKGVIDSGCSWHMTGNMSYLSNFQELNDGYVAFGGNPKGGKILGKGKIKTGKLDFKDVYFVKELKFNLFSVSQMCDKKNKNRVLVTKPHNKTPYELLHGRTPSIGFMRPFGCPVTIFNTLDSLRKFEGKVDEGFLVGYSVNSKAFRVFNSRTRIIQETLHVNFLENKPNVEVTIGNQTNPSAGFQETFDADKVGEEANLQYVLFPIWSTGSSNPHNKEGDAAFDEKEHDAEKPESTVNLSQIRSALSGEKDDMTKKKDKGKSLVEYFLEYRDLNAVFEDFSEDSSNDVSAASPIVPTAGQNYSNSTNPISAAGPIVPAAGHNYSNNTNLISVVGPSNSNSSPTHGQSSLRNTYQPPDMVERKDIVYSDHENVSAETDFNNLETSITEELLQFKMQKVWILVDLPLGKRAISTKWVYKNKKDERGIVVRNKARLIASGHIQKEGIDYEEVFAPVVRIESIRLFLAYASFMGFMVYQMDVKSAFLYGTIEEEAPRAWYETLANYLLKNEFHRGQIDQTPFIKKQKGDILLVQIYVDDIIFGATNKDLCKSFEKLMKDKFQMSSMGELTFFLGLQVKQKKDGIFISQDKYVAEILNKFGLTEGKSASTLIDTEKPLLKDSDGEDVDVHIYRLMIGSLMYLTSSRPDIMFASDASEGFDQIIDFHNGSYIAYALTVNPTIYVSCIKQFRRTVAVKSSNDVTRLQALVNKKKVVVTEAVIRDALHLDDAVSLEKSNKKVIGLRMSTSYQSIFVL
nr:hypothetical protein [Tanacetum cinerariifolium]